MKSQSLITALILTSSLLSISAFAREVGPCRKIKQACESAGFKKGDHKSNGKGLYVDCMKKIMSGETVPGVSASSDEVAACKAKKEHHAARKNGS